MKKLKEPVGDRAPDRGAALILVLVIVTVIGVAGAALLTFSDTSIRTTVALRDQAGNAYNADGAAQVAIDSLSNGYGFMSSHLFENATGTKCFGLGTLSGTRNLPDFYPGTSGLNGTAPSSASVVCTADPDTGVNGTSVSINADNRPGQAILTLGQITGEDGINVKALSGNPFSVKGTVKSNSNINVVSGTLQSTAAVTAHSGCSGTILSNPGQVCNVVAATDDPGYAVEPHFISADAVPTYHAVPTICPGGVVTFEPGYYDDAKALTDLMSGGPGSPGTCRGASTWWFTPGTYYFDFHNNTNDSDVYKGSGNTDNKSSADQWRITRGHLVAGTPADIGGPGASPTIPGSCLNPITFGSAQGVQFIFGGDSQLALGGSASGEICGTYHADRPPIGVFGLKSGEATTTTLGLPLSLSNAGTPADDRFVIAPTGTSATWDKGTSTLETSTITASYAPPPAIPAGSIVKSAFIRVRHGNSSGYATNGKKTADNDKLALTFTPTGGITIPITQPTLNPGTDLTTDSIDIYGGGTSDFVKFVHDHGFTGAAMAYTATLNHAGTESLDAIQIDIVYVAPAFRNENIEMTPDPNCLTQAYTGKPGGGCPVLSTGLPGLGSYSGTFYVQGTTYTPIAAIDLTLNNATQQALRFGVISRSLWITETGSLTYSGPVIELPDETSGGNSAPIVLLRVYVCPGTTKFFCSAGPVDPTHPERGPIEALRVKAMMGDSTAPPSKMTILSWSNLR